MTSADAVMVLLRRWPVVVAGLLMTGAAVFSVTTNHGVYSAQTDVLFLAPKSAVAPNPIEASSDSLIATAGLVARIVDGGEAAPATASSGVSLPSRGIRRGYSIELPNSGGQWVNNFDRPILVVRVAGPSEEWVRSTLAIQIDRVNDTLASLQEEDGIPDRNSIITSSAPRTSTVDYIRGDAKRAGAATVLLGLTLTGLAAMGVDRLVSRTTRACAIRARSIRTEST